jgi:hypothetical protein
VFFWLQHLEMLSPWALALEVLQVAFTVWMAVDAYRRGVDYFWLWIIIIFQPLGPWVYFFAIKLRDFRLPAGRPAVVAVKSRRSLKELRYHADRAPTVANRLALAECLMDKKQHGEAIPLLEAILKMEPGYCTALHDIALCHLACGEPSKAIGPLQVLLERDHRWSDYRAWRTLVDAQDALEQPDQALQSMRELTKRMPTLENTCLLAGRLIDLGQHRDAADVLDRGLTDYEYTRLGARLRNWRWARAARRLLKEAEAAEPVG